MDEMQRVYLFREGNCAYAHQFMGALPWKGGYDFAAYGRAGRAGGQRRGDFNDWDSLRKIHGEPRRHLDGAHTGRQAVRHL